MFGHNDQQPQDGNQPAPDGAVDDQSGGAPQVNDVNDTAGEYIEDGGPAAGTPTVTHPDDTAISDDADVPADDNGGVGDNADAPTLPAPATTDATDDVSSAGDDDTADVTEAASATDAPTPAATPTPDADALLGIKQQALQQLTPLIGHLDQTPEEKFRTTMMMIQAADNHALIQDAYEAAKQITDEKVRAQALLDIVNEINYFTHNAGKEAQAA